MSSLPTGTITFLFSDIEGSTKLLQRLGDRYADVLGRHEELMREAFAATGGTEVGTEGDSFFVVFERPTDAAQAAVQAQRALAGEAWPEGETVRVRMGLHTGEGKLGGRDYVGLDVHRAARVMGAAHGGQVLLSDPTRSLVERSLPDGVALRDLGPHRLKDLTEPERLWQLVVEGLPQEFPALRSLDARPNNLPAQRTSFVGRERELAAAKDLLSRTRLLTLTGAGGTGKTRLALELAADLLLEYEHGAWFVDLSPLNEPSLVPSVIAQVLGVTESADRQLDQTLADHLAEKEILLVLDNFERVLDAATVIGDLLTRAPRLRVIATSREALRLMGEQEYAVPPLELPDRHDVEADTLSQFAAVALFIDRALAVAPAFAVTNENAPAVAEITSRLDGLPLAIELAASRAKLLTPQQILDRLERRLPLLTGGARDVPERQRTLRGAIEWSYDLLDEDERRLFEHVSVFMGGGTLEAMEAVCSLAAGTDTFTGLASLVDKSMLRQADTDGEARFVMLETIREYGQERLAERGEREDLAARHAAFFLALAEDAEPHITAADGAAWIDRLTRDHDNLRAALRWCIESGDADTGLRMAGALWRFWHQRAHFREARAWFDELLALPAAAGRSEARIRGLTGLGGIAYWQGDYPVAEAAYREAADIARELGDPKQSGLAVQNLSYMPALRGDLPGSIRLAAEAADLLDQAGLVDEADMLRGQSGYYHVMIGEVGKGRPLLERASAAAEGSGDAFRIASSRHAMGQLERLSGNLDAATALYREAIEGFRSAGDNASMLEPLEASASVLSMRGQHDRAVRLVGAVRAAREKLGGGPPPEWMMPADVLGEARKAIGEPAVERLLEEGRHLSQEQAVEEALKPA